LTLAGEVKNEKKNERDENKNYYLFLSSLAGGIEQILQSDWFLERAEFLIRTATAGGIRRVDLKSTIFVNELALIVDLFAVFTLP